MGTPEPIYVPDGVNPQKFVDEGMGMSQGTISSLVKVGYLWRPKGPRDYKRQNPIYDAFGNFGFGAEGAAAGQTFGDLGAGGDVAHCGNRNSQTNDRDIRSGVTAVGAGGTLSTTHVNCPGESR